MAQLTGRERAQLPDSAFAYVDSKGKRRLPIHDESHVRNALARFEQVAFESPEARERARKRLLNAAKKFGIVPVGFITSQIEVEKQHAIDLADLPTGFVTMLLTDIEGSTLLLRELGGDYSELLTGVRDVISRCVAAAGGRHVEMRADESFSVFADAAPAVTAGVEIQRCLGRSTWPGGSAVRVRIGIHSGAVTLTESGYIGLAVHAAARVGFAGHGGQILVSGDTKAAVEGGAPPGIGFRPLGAHQLAGLPRPVDLFQIEADRLAVDFPPLRA